jgi:L-alanine-DL-glutamate epimerase-like enolase superfamily enzyme
MRHAFAIARGSRTVSPSIIVKLTHEGITGFGEAAPSPRYNETRETVESFLASVDLLRFSNPEEIDAILDYVNAIALGNYSAKAAVDIALHDWLGKRRELPPWKLWGLDKSKMPLSSFTIGIDAPAIVEQKTREASAYPIYKVKVGVPNDEEIIRAIRRVSSHPIRVDANEGWNTKERALEKILWLERQGVELVEQPLPASMQEDTGWLKNCIHIPVMADESVKNAADVPMLAEAFGGINIKLMKSGGLREAMRMIVAAKANGLKVMLGCMIESSIAIAAAAQLAPLADYLDLDGNILISNDPFDGIPNNFGRLELSDRPGLGVFERISNSVTAN